MKVFIFLVSILFSGFSLARSEVLYLTDESKALDIALDVVEGEVVDGTVVHQSHEKSCFSYLYRLKVEKSYKGVIGESRIINVGLNLDSFPVRPGQQHFILLMELPGNYYDFCRAGEAKKYEDLKITLGYMVGFFEIYYDLAGDKKYKGVSCDNDVPIMFESYADRKEPVSGRCYQVVGNYKSLKENVQRELSLLSAIKDDKKDTHRNKKGQPIIEKYN